MTDFDYFRDVDESVFNSLLQGKEYYRTSWKFYWSESSVYVILLLLFYSYVSLVPVIFVNESRNLESSAEKACNFIKYLFNFIAVDQKFLCIGLQLHLPINL